MHGEHTRARSPELRPGEVFADHRIEAILGKGGMGVVYRATDLRLNRAVALKLIKPELSHDDDFRRRFRRESELAASVRQPNVVTIYQAGDSNGLLFVTMDLIDGTDLRSVISRHGRLDAVTAGEVTAQVAAALDAAHASGLVHRDVKPANVLVAGGTPMHVYLTDFGLTKRTSSQSGLTKTGLFVGTIDYAAPEQIQGFAVDARTDVYALGCVLFEMLTGRAPFRRDNDYATLYAQIHEPAPMPSSVMANVPRGFDAVIARALAKHPDERYPSAGDLARAALAATAGELPREPERTVAIGPAAPAPPLQMDPSATHMAAPAPVTAPPAAAVTPPPAAPPAYQPPPPPPSHVTSVLPPAKSRNPWPIVVVLIVALLVAGGVAAYLLMGGDDGGGDPPANSQSNVITTPQQVAPQQEEPSGQSPQETEDQLHGEVTQIGDILDQSAEGRAASVNGDFSSAMANRREVLEQVDALTVSDELERSRTLLRTAANASLNSTIAHLACGNCLRAQAADRRATTAKRRFVAEFNPYAERFLQRSFDDDDI